MEKILSVCIPTYNMEALLPRCLDSFILEKEYMDQLEIIIVNDGSRDKSSAIAHEYADKYPQTFKVIDKTNGNYGSCINAALKDARGKYFRICDADDRYEKNNLKEYLDYLKESNAELVFSPYTVLSVDDTIMEVIKCPIDLLRKSFNIDDLDWGNLEIKKMRAMHCIAISPSILTKHDYVQTEGISYTDTQFSFCALLYSSTCSFFDKNIYLYYLGRDGQTMSKEAVVRTHMHFYINADKMLDTYAKFSTPISENRQLILIDCLYSEISIFISVVMENNITSCGQVEKIKMFLKKSKETFNPCRVEEQLLQSLGYFKIWRKYHTHIWIVSLLLKIRIALFK